MLPDQRTANYLIWHKVDVIAVFPTGTSKQKKQL